MNTIQAADVPTLNQNTSGTAAGLSATLAVASGGTGSTTLTANNVLLGNGTSALQVVAPGTSGNVLTSNGSTWTSAAVSNAYPGLRGQFFSSSGTFTIPTGITAIKVSLVSGGGGGSGGYSVGCSTGVGSRGGPGGSAVQTFTGLTPGNTLTVTVGAAGSGGASFNGNGTSGGTSSVASGTQTITTIQATGGGGGIANGAAGSTGTVSGVTNNTSGVMGYAIDPTFITTSAIGTNTQYAPYTMPLPLGSTGGKGGLPGIGGNFPANGTAGIQGYVLIEY
jgi:hypothetical protein